MSEKSERAQKEEKILQFWKENKIFEKTLEKKSPKGDFVFYEGPPTANGRPGLHHIEALWKILAHVEKRNLLYKDYKVLPWCSRCGTALSSHELAQGYQDVKDISLYV